MLCRIISNFVVRIVHREHILRGVHLPIYLCQPRAWCGSIKHVHCVIPRTAIPRLCCPHRHRFGPLLQRGVSYQRCNRHPCPHCTSMHIGFVFFIVCFSSSKNYLKTQTPSWHRRYCNRHGVNKLAMILLVIMGIFFPYPAFEIRYVALQVRQLTPPSSPCLP